MTNVRQPKAASFSCNAAMLLLFITLVYEMRQDFTKLIFRVRWLRMKAWHSCDLCRKQRNAKDFQRNRKFMFACLTKRLVLNKIRDIEQWETIIPSVASKKHTFRLIFPKALYHALIVIDNTVFKKRKKTALASLRSWNKRWSHDRLLRYCTISAHEVFNILETFMELTATVFNIYNLM